MTDHLFDPATGAAGHSQVTRNQEPLSARARRSDPATSHEAAQSVTNISRIQRRILSMIGKLGALCDEQIAENYAGRWPDQPVSPSGLRTRRSELVRDEYLVDAGYTQRTKSGRRTIAWILTDKGRSLTFGGRNNNAG